MRVRVQIGQYENALLIPERAIGRDQVGMFVYVVDDENKAVRKNVKLGTKHEDMIVIESGLEPADSVIVDGIQRVRTGIEVDPVVVTRLALPCQTSLFRLNNPVVRTTFTRAIFELCRNSLSTARFSLPSFRS